MNVINCSNCGQSLEHTHDFFYTTHGKLGKQCKRCQNLKRQEYHNRNRERENARWREWYETNREQINMARRRKRRTIKMV